MQPNGDPLYGRFHKDYIFNLIMASFPANTARMIIERHNALRSGDMTPEYIDLTANLRVYSDGRVIQRQTGEHIPMKRSNTNEFICKHPDLITCFGKRRVSRSRIIMAAYEGYLLPTREELANAYRQLNFPVPDINKFIVGIVDGDRRNNSILTNCWMTLAYRQTIVSDQGRRPRKLDKEQAKEIKGLHERLSSIGHKTDIVVLAKVVGYKNSYSSVYGLINDKTYPDTRGESTEPRNIILENYLDGWVADQNLQEKEKAGQLDRLFGIIQDRYQEFFNMGGLNNEQENRT